MLEDTYATIFDPHMFGYSVIVPIASRSCKTSTNKEELRLPRFFRANLLSFNIDHPAFLHLLEHLYEFSKSAVVHAGSFHSIKNSIEDEPQVETS